MQVLRPKEHGQIHFAVWRLSMTEQELEERTTELIDREELRKAILAFEIENIKRAVKQVEDISGFSKGKGTGEHH